MPKRGENIYKRKDGRYEGRYVKTVESSTGKIKYGYVYDRTYKHTKEKLRQKQSVVHTKEIVGKETLADWLNHWFFQVCSIQVRDSSMSCYYNIIYNHIIPELGLTLLHRLTRDQVQIFLNQRLKQGKNGRPLSAKTVRDVYTLLNSALEYAVQSEKLTINPCRFIKLPPNIYESKRVLNRVEQNRLEQYALSNQGNISMCIFLCLYSGIRIGELCALQWKDIDFENNTLNITKTIKRIKNFENTEKKTTLLIGTPKTKASRRLIILPSNLMDFLKEYTPKQPEFYIATGKADFCDARIVQHHFSRIVKECGIMQANFHALRHTYATRMIELGVDTKTLSELLGHANAGVTLKCYVHSFTEHKKGAVEKLNEIFKYKPSEN